MNALLKTCKECGDEKPATLDVFYASPTTKDGFQTRCKVCVKAINKARYAGAKR